jgi:hypothetical protein
VEQKIIASKNFIKKTCLPKQTGFFMKRFYSWLVTLFQGGINHNKKFKINRGTISQTAVIT